jgi:hypothetical protein
MASLQSLKASWVQASRAVSATAERNDPEITAVNNPSARIAENRPSSASTFFIAKSSSHATPIPLPWPGRASNIVIIARNKLLDGPDVARNAGSLNAAAADGFRPSGLM